MDASDAYSGCAQRAKRGKCEEADSAKFVLALSGYCLDIYIYHSISYGGTVDMSKLLKLYISGFVLSFILTVASFAFVYFHLVSSGALLILVLLLALIQLLVQLIFFLHLGQEKRPRYQLMFFISTFSIILIMIIGSIWIMSNLNYNMSPQQVNSYLQDQSGF